MEVDVCVNATERYLLKWNLRNVITVMTTLFTIGYYTGYNNYIRYMLLLILY